MASFYSCGYRGDSCGSLEPPFELNYSIFMRNFKQNQHKLSNNQFDVGIMWFNMLACYKI